jgi:anti-sigma-K factor RskA
MIESYVLGLATAEERAEFEKLCQEYPELAAARNRFEIALEQKLQNQAVPPAGDLKDRVLNAIRQQPTVNQTKLITMESTNASRSSSTTRWVTAASIILLLGASFFAYKFYTENQELKATIQKNEGVQRKTDSLQQELSKIDSLIKDPNTMVVNMVGTQQAPQSSANIYWDSTSTDVYLVVKNMPALPNDKQYQLWALLNGKDGSLQPTSLGLFDIADKNVVLKMKNTQKADAFAITIENRGNTGGPNLGQLQNMGKTKL